MNSCPKTTYHRAKTRSQKPIHRSWREYPYGRKTYTKFPVHQATIIVILHNTKTQTFNLYAYKGYYTPRLGRFAQEDIVKSVSHKMPNGQAVGDPLSLNLYTYCMNNPIAYIDPSGMTAEEAEIYRTYVPKPVFDPTGKAYNSYTNWDDYWTAQVKWKERYDEIYNRIALGSPTEKFLVKIDHGFKCKCGGHAGQYDEKGNYYTHAGDDFLKSRAGDTAYAAIGGTVIQSGHVGAKGLCVVVESWHNGNRILTEYQHLDSVEKFIIGETIVCLGDTIGVLGQTGNANADLLHFGVMINGVYVNPLPLIRPQFAGKFNEEQLG